MSQRRGHELHSCPLPSGEAAGTALREEVAAHDHLGRAALRVSAPVLSIMEVVTQQLDSPNRDGIEVVVAGTGDVGIGNGNVARLVDLDRLLCAVAAQRHVIKQHSLTKLAVEYVAAVVEPQAAQRQSVDAVNVHSCQPRCVATVNALNRDRPAPPLPVDRRATAVTAALKPQQPAARVACRDPAPSGAERAQRCTPSPARGVRA
ncbi:unannotated protein [freshwater metagenome]|uniref:Unannotated protein n=1 Tax=freshwater metagenome TaxID=449393 RepID=A0A6J7RVZ6_9ZZZZ